MQKIEAKALRAPASRLLLNVTKGALDHCEEECTHLRAINVELTAVLEGLHWEPIDRDNMEFECRTTYHVLGKIRAAIAKAKGEA